MALLDGLLDKTGHEDITPQVHVLPQVQARRGGAEPQLHGLQRLAGHGTPDGPLGAGFDAHGRVAVRLDAARQVVKGGRVGDVAGGETAG